MATATIEPNVEQHRGKIPDRDLLVLLGLYLASFLLILFVSQMHFPSWVGLILAIIPPVVAAILTVRLRKDWTSLTPLWQHIIIVAPLVVVAGLALLLILGQPTRGFGYFAVVTAIIWIGQVISALRHHFAVRPSRNKWSYVAMAVATGLLAIGLLVPDGWLSVGLLFFGSVFCLIALGLFTGTLLARGTAPQRPQLWLGIIVWSLTWIVMGIWFRENMPLANPFILSILIIGFIGLLVTLIAVDNMSDTVLVVVAISFLYFTQPMTPAVSFGGGTGDGYLVALGDSYMSGEGADSFYEGTNDKGGNECRRAETAYAPQMLKLQGDVPEQARFSDLLFLACSGAIGDEVIDQPQHTAQPQLQAFLHEWETTAKKRDPKLVILSIGGNDAGFGSIAQSCLLPGNCAEIGDQWMKGLDGVKRKVTDTYTALRAGMMAKGIETPVLVVPYPIPLTKTGCPWSSVAFTADEHRFLFGFVHELDAVIKSAAEQAGFYYLDAMENVLVDKHLAICSTVGDTKQPVDLGDLGINFLGFNSVVGSPGEIVFPGNWLHNSFHPNARGHQAMRDVLVQWLVANPTLMPLSETVASNEHAIESFDEVMDASGTASTGVGTSSETTTDGWGISQLALFLKLHILPLILAAIGAWLFCLQGLRLWRIRPERDVEGFKKRVRAVPPFVAAFVLLIFTRRSVDELWGGAKK